MKTYQLNVELQVDSPSKDAKDLGDKWHTVLCDIIEDVLEADHVTVSGVKCVETPKCIVTTKCLFVHKYTAQVAHSIIRALDKAECDGGDGEYDAPAEAALKKQFPNNSIVEWSCLAVHAPGYFIVFENVRIVFKAVP